MSEPSQIKRKRSRIEQNLHKGDNPDEEYVFSNIGESIQDEDDTGFENTNSDAGDKEKQKSEMRRGSQQSGEEVAEDRDSSKSEDRFYFINNQSNQMAPRR